MGCNKQQRCMVCRLSLAEVLLLLMDDADHDLYDFLLNRR